MDFADRAALTIHDVKNRLTLVAQRAEAAGDAATLREMLEAAAALSALLAWAAYWSVVLFAWRRSARHG